MAAPTGSAPRSWRRASGRCCPRTEALTGAAVAEEQSDAAKEGLGFLSVALMGFAGVALFVGAFIIWNTFSMQVAQRTGSWRCSGRSAPPAARCCGVLVAESLLLGLVSSLVGVLLGMGLAGGLGALMAAFGFSLPTAGIRLDLPGTRGRGVLVGTLVTVVSAIAPARRATKVLPVEALRDAAPQVFRTSRLRILAGLLLVAAGATGLLAALFGGAPAILVALGTVGGRPRGGHPGAPARPADGRGDRGAAHPRGVRASWRSRTRCATRGVPPRPPWPSSSASPWSRRSRCSPRPLKASFSDVLGSTKADLYVLTPTSQSEGFSREVIDEVARVDGVELISPSGFGMAEIEGSGQALS